MASPLASELKKRLKAALGRRKVTIDLSDGEPLTFYYKPLTLDEEERIRASVASDTRSDAYGIKLMIAKMEDEGGQKYFAQLDAGLIRGSFNGYDIKGIMLAMMNNNGDLYVADDEGMKSSEGGAEV